MTYTGYFVPKSSQETKTEGIVTLRGTIDGDRDHSTLSVAVASSMDNSPGGALHFTTSSPMAAGPSRFRDALDVRRSLIAPLVKKCLSRVNKTCSSPGARSSRSYFDLRKSHDDLGSYLIHCTRRTNEFI